MIDKKVLEYHGWVDMPSGHGLHIYTDPRVGGSPVCVSDEVGGGVEVWHTALVSAETLRFVLDFHVGDWLILEEIDRKPNATQTT